MEELFRSYLALLGELAGVLDRLAPLSQKKAETVRADDLLALDDVLKQEQALSLTLRGVELRRVKLSSQLGLDNVRLDDLSKHCPPELKAEAQKAVDALRHSYNIYRSYSDMARSTLELNIHQIEKAISASGMDPKLAAEGYETPVAEPPKNMKTDFRA